ncbi:MAG: hypothetical protein AB7F31_04050 [Parachlamydiales bacterium]
MAIAVRFYNDHPTIPRTVVGVGTALTLYNLVRWVFALPSGNASTLYRLKGMNIGSLMVVAHIFSARCSYVEVDLKPGFEKDPLLYSGPLLDGLMVKASFGYPDPKPVVTFWETEETKGPAIDAGGPGRVFLYLLCESIKDNLQGSKEPPLYLPAGKALDTQRSDLHRHWGFLLAYCYHSRPNNVFQPMVDSTLSTGVHADPRLFQAIFSLSAEEVEGKIDNLPVQRQAELYRSVIDAFVPSTEGYSKMLASVTTEEKAAKFLQDTLVDRDETPSALEQLFNYAAGELTRYNVRERLLEIQRMAKGMKEWCDTYPDYPERSWEAVRKIDPIDFSEKAQGFADREKLAARIMLFLAEEVAYNDVVDKMKQWIKNPSTSTKKIDIFLRLVTGTNGLRPDQQITLASADVVGEPRFDTCGTKLWLPLKELVKLNQEDFDSYMNDQIAVEIEKKSRTSEFTDG